MSTKVKTYNKGECLAIEGDDLTNILNLCITRIKANNGRPSEYPNTTDGLESFRSKTLEFFEYVNDVNRNPDTEKKIVPDVEAWATYLGVTRRTIIAYEKRSAEWYDTIQAFKNAIASCKKQLALTYKIPPMIAVFDLTNNHGYVNSNEFHLVPETRNPTADQGIKVELQKQIEQAGLIWDEEKGEYIQSEGTKNNE